MNDYEKERKLRKIKCCKGFLDYIVKGWCNKKVETSKYNENMKIRKTVAEGMTLFKEPKAFNAKYCRVIFPRDLNNA